MDAFRQARTAYIAACASGDAGHIQRARRVLDAAHAALPKGERVGVAVNAQRLA